MITLSNLYNKYYEDNDVIYLWNMAQNAFYYQECVNEGNLDKCLVDIIVSPNNKTNTDRLAMIWRKNEFTKKLHDIWKVRPHG